MSASSPKTDSHTTRKAKTKASGFRAPTASRSVAELLYGDSLDKGSAVSRDDRTAAALGTNTTPNLQSATKFESTERPPSAAAALKSSTTVRYGKPSFAGMLPSADLSNTSASQLEDELVSAAVNKQYEEYDEHDPDWMPKTPTATKAGQARSSSNKKRKHHSIVDEADVHVPKHIQKRNAGPESGIGTSPTKPMKEEHHHQEDHLTIVLDDDEGLTTPEIAAVARSPPPEEMPHEREPIVKPSPPSAAPAPASRVEEHESHSDISTARYLQYRVRKSQLKAEIARKFADLASLRAEFRRSEYEAMLPNTMDRTT